MKYEFDKNKINIFTIIPHSFREERVRKNCIESWKKIPNANIYLFDAATDIRDTFPGMLENDKLYKMMNNENDGKQQINTNVSIYNKSENKIEYKDYNLSISNREGAFSFDTIRLKMLQEIPNAIYIDSDIYIYDIQRFLNVYDRCEFATMEWRSTSFVINKNKSIFIDKLLEFYDKELTKVCVDWSAITAFYNKHVENNDKLRLSGLLNGFTAYDLNTFFSHFHNPKWIIKRNEEKYNNICDKIDQVSLIYYDAIKYNFSCVKYPTVKMKIKQIIENNNNKDKNVLYVVDIDTYNECIDNGYTDIDKGKIIVINSTEILAYYYRDKNIKDIVFDIILKMYNIKKELLKDAEFDIKQID